MKALNRYSVENVVSIDDVIDALADVVYNSMRGPQLSISSAMKRVLEVLSSYEEFRESPRLLLRSALRTHVTRMVDEIFYERLDENSVGPVLFDVATFLEWANKSPLMKAFLEEATSQLFVGVNYVEFEASKPNPIANYVAKKR